MGLLIIFLVISLSPLAVSAEDEVSGWKYSSESGYCYKLNKKRQTWDDAEQSCYESAPHKNVKFHITHTVNFEIYIIFFTLG